MLDPKLYFRQVSELENRSSGERHEKERRTEDGGQLRRDRLRGWEREVLPSGCILFRLFPPLPFR